MGEIWEGYHRELDTSVAIKLVRGGGQTPELRARLGTEARALAQLEHPAILRVLDFSHSEGGNPYLVTELLDGECLDVFILRNGPLAPQAAVQLLLPIVDGLGIAHERNIVHRDLKPANVFLARTSGRRLQPKLLDFGIARVQQPANLKITMDGALLGSPEYMAPEQARGDSQVDARTDVWALCVLLYEAVSGRTPFEGENYHATLRNIVEQPPVRPAELDGPDRDLWNIIERGLQKPAEKRWQSMLELGRALAEWLLAHGVLEDSTGASLRGTWLQLPTDLTISSFPPVAISASISLPERGAGTPPPSNAGATLDAADPNRRNARMSTGGAGAVEVEAAPYRPWARRVRHGALAGSLMLAGIVLLGLATGAEDRTAVRSWASIELGTAPPPPTAETLTTRVARTGAAAVAALARRSERPPETPDSVAPESAPEESHTDTPTRKPVRAARQPPVANPPPRAPESLETNSARELKDPYQ
jgi:serine/threonine-protein kinase